MTSASPRPNKPWVTTYHDGLVLEVLFSEPFLLFSQTYAIAILANQQHEA